MKPLLLIPPAPARWPALHDLFSHKGPPWTTDIEGRFVTGVAGAQDVYAVLSEAGRFMAGACINKCGDVGVLGHCFTRPERRRRGYARRLIEALLAWFDMRGGRWLMLTTTGDWAETVYAKFGFCELRRLAWQPRERVTMLRTRPGVGDEPYAEVAGDVSVRDVARAEWPALAMLLQFQPGPDPRVSIAESGVVAELFTLDLLDHQDRGKCRLLGAFRGARLMGLASLATDAEGPRTYSMLMPHAGAPAELRDAVCAAARERGYANVAFPMEALAAAPVAALEDAPR
jgi:GNAT superfamily N-acetyltransferase